jgi:HEAT repeat protein
LALAPAELARFPTLLRRLLGSIQKARLYPIESQPVTQALEELQESLEDLTSNRLALTLASTDRSLLVNGTKLDTSGFSGLAANLIEIMGAAALSSISFLSDVPLPELKAFVGALRDNPAVGDSSFWDELANANGLSSIIFNQRRYIPAVLESLLGTAEIEITDEGVEDDEAPTAGETALAGPVAALRDSLPVFGKQLLLKGEDRLVKRMVNRLFDNFASQDAADREATLQTCRRLLDDLVLGLQHKLSLAIVDPMLAALATENEPKVLQELSPTLSSMANRALYFADYTLATRVLLGLRERREQTGQPGAEHIGLAKTLSPRLDRAANQLLKDDLRSGQSDRQAPAADVIGALGKPAIPLLIDLIRQENDSRVRQMAAKLLTAAGPEAGKELKRALATEVTVEQRFRVLEVIDIVTGDLRNEITYCFGDASAKIRRAAFRLFERLQNDALIDVILPLAFSKEAAMAKGAIKSLAQIKSPASVGALISVLDSTADPKVATACCQALGDLGHASAIKALSTVLAQRRLPFFMRRWGEQVRATAAMALRQIPDARAAAVLARYTNDRQTRVRLLARSPAV